MSDCSTRDYSVCGISGRVVWKDGSESPVTFASVANGKPREADFVELDGIRFERVVHCLDCRHWHHHRCDLNDEWRDEREYCWCGEVE